MARYGQADECYLHDLKLLSESGSTLRDISALQVSFERTALSESREGVEWVLAEKHQA
jgi:hypothetical protein